MPFLRSLLLVAVLALGLSSTARADEAVGGADSMVIVLEHHWVVEIAGQRFGLIQFDTPMTIVLLGGIDFDVPAPAVAVVLPLFVVPMLFAVGIAWQSRRRRLELFGQRMAAA